MCSYTTPWRHINPEPVFKEFFLAVSEITSNLSLRKNKSLVIGTTKRRAKFTKNEVKTGIVRMNFENTSLLVQIFFIDLQHVSVFW